MDAGECLRKGANRSLLAAVGWLHEISLREINVV